MLRCAWMKIYMCLVPPSLSSSPSSSSFPILFFLHMSAVPHVILLHPFLVYRGSFLASFPYFVLSLHVSAVSHVPCCIPFSHYTDRELPCHLTTAISKICKTVSSLIHGSSNTTLLPRRHMWVQAAKRFVCRSAKPPRIR